MINENHKPEIGQSLPVWKDPFRTGPIVGFGEDSLRVQSEIDQQILLGNILEMSRKAEEEWYLGLVVSVLESKGYTVTKVAASEH